MWLKSTIAAISSVLLLCVSGCAFTSANTAVQRNHESRAQNAAAKDIFQIESLSFANNPRELAGAAERLCTDLCTYEQKMRAYQIALYAYNKASKDKFVALTLARCAFKAADIEPDDDMIKEITQIGMEAARVAIGEQKDPVASYYFALNMGLFITADGFTAINMLPEMVERLKDANKEPNQDLGGPMRVLGMLYLKAPPWPRGIGDIDASIELLRQAAEKFPSHPQNHFFYANALIENDQNEEAMKEIEIAEKIAIPELWGVYSDVWQKDIAELKSEIED